MANKENKRYVCILEEEYRQCSYCCHYDGWFGACFAEIDGVGKPEQHNLRHDNINSPAALCDLYADYWEVEK